ncbi:hypothetical protein WJX81_001002 [Elliptochloris bilobata]|uniref:ATP-dependent (S)-NAD(P)H-hydrate dehydratase n=1 Tax=Elliptochloris bilobata TaxID=381761 RepID=A0AAW1R1F8_9CHLO
MMSPVGGYLRQPASTLVVCCARGVGALRSAGPSALFALRSRPLCGSGSDRLLATRRCGSWGARASSMSPEELQGLVQQIVPKLTGDKSKGQAGKIATIGGCREYTGAPFFASYSALKVGSDLSHVFCTDGAATVIKSYSPELIVHPYLPDEGAYEAKYANATSRVPFDGMVQERTEQIQAWLKRFDVVIIGPGLGRDEMTMKTVVNVIRLLREREISVVIDADGLFIVTRNLDLVRGNPRCILTPNKAEFGRLAAALDIDLESGSDHLRRCAAALGGPTIVRKGAADGICDGEVLLECSAAGSKRRAGGQGDVMSGCVAAFLSWAVNYGKQTGANQVRDFPGGLPPPVLASYGGCLTARVAAAAAFAKKGRSMLAADVIEELGAAVDKLFDHE